MRDGKDIPRGARPNWRAAHIPPNWAFTPGSEISGLVSVDGRWEIRERPTDVAVYDGDSRDDSRNEEARGRDHPGGSWWELARCD